MMEVKVGDKIPAVDMRELVTGEEKPRTVNLGDAIAGKKVAIFGVPGAFTPGCSKSHLPSFMDAQADLKAKGIEMTICVATNDAFVMEVSLRECTSKLDTSVGSQGQISRQGPTDSHYFR